MFDLNEKIKRARQEAIGMSAVAILIGGLIYSTIDNTIEVTANTQEDTHIVESGDTLWRISVDNHVSLDSLMTRNGLVGDLIHPGDELSIPHTKQPVLTSSTSSAPAKVYGNELSKEQPAKIYGNELSKEQYETLLMVAQQESGGQDYNAVLAVMSVITNRVDTNGYDDTVWGVITASGQFEAYGAGHYLRHEGKITQTTKDAVNDALNGKKNVDVLNFWSDWYYNEKGRSDSEAINIGGNVFFNL